MSPEERLAAALASHPVRKGYDVLELARHILHIDPSIGADMELGSAWRAIIAPEHEKITVGHRPEPEPKA